MKIDGTLVIRWREQGAVDLSFVPAGARPGLPVPTRRLRDLADLRRRLTRLGVEPQRVDEAVGSPYVLQSLLVRVDRRAAGRLGLVSTTLSERALGRLTDLMTPPVRIARLMATWLVRSRAH